MSALAIPFPPPALTALTPPTGGGATTPPRVYTPLTKALTRFMERHGEPLLYASRAGGVRTVRGRVTVKGAIDAARSLSAENSAEIVRRRICVISPEHWDGAGFLIRPRIGDEITDSERRYRVCDVEVARDAGTDGRYEMKLEGR